MSTKDAIIIDLSNPKQRAMLLGYIKGLKGIHRVKITRCRNQRSMAQNAYLWAVVYPAVANGLEEAWGERLSVEEVHEWCKGRFNSRLIVDRNTGDVKGRRPVSTTALDTAQCTEYIEKIIRFAAEDLGVEVPPATPAKEASRAA